MKNIWISVFLFVFFTSVFGVSTRFINDLQFDRIQSFSFSNIAFREDGGVELSSAVQTVYQSKDPIWSFVQDHGKSYLGKGSVATIQEWDGKTKKTVYSDTNASFVSEILKLQNGWMISEIPDKKIRVLNNKFVLRRSYSVTNLYTWGLVKYDGGVVVIGGYPASLSLIKDGKVKLLTVLENEEHLFKGVADKQNLYFNGERTLYVYRKGKALALASFDQPIADFVATNGVIYVITSSSVGNAKPKKSNNNNNRNSSSKNSVKSKDSSFAQNSLWKVVPWQNQSLLAAQSGLSFLSLDLLGERLLIGTDKDGGYFTFSLADKVLSYASLGKGSFVKMFSVGKSVYGVLLYPSRVVRFDSGYAGSGWLQSDIQDTGNISKWGLPRMRTKIPPRSFVHLHTRSGAVENTDYWDDWMELDGKTGKIRSLPNRYFQYRINLTSDGNLSPQVSALSIPFVQNNLPPKIDVPTVHYQKNGVKITWNLLDPNGDQTEKRIFLENTNGMEIPLGEKTIRKDQFELNVGDFPPGKYRLRIVCSDKPSNSEHTALSSEIKTPFFYIDGQAPKISGLRVKALANNEFEITFLATDNLIPIGGATYSLNGEADNGILPEDGIFDQLDETFSLKVKVSSPALLNIKVSDRLGNTVSKGIWLK